MDFTVLQSGIDSGQSLSPPPGLPEAPDGEAGQLPDQVRREHEKQDCGLAIPHGAVQRAVKGGKTAPTVFAKHRFTDHVDGEWQNHQPKKHQAKE